MAFHAPHLALLGVRFAGLREAVGFRDVVVVLLGDLRALRLAGLNTDDFLAVAEDLRFVGDFADFFVDVRGMTQPPMSAKRGAARRLRLKAYDVKPTHLGSVYRLPDRPGRFGGRANTFAAFRARLLRAFACDEAFRFAL